MRVLSTCLISKTYRKAKNALNYSSLRKKFVIILMPRHARQKEIETTMQHYSAITGSDISRDPVPHNRLRQMGVKVLSRNGFCLFAWAGPALTSEDAESMAKAAYAQAAKAVLNTYQLSEPDLGEGLLADRCIATQLRTPTHWKLSGAIQATAYCHDNAVLAALNKDDTQSLLNSAIAADPICFDALINRKTVTASLWVHRIASNGMSEIDHAITIEGDASPMKRRVGDRVLRDTLRIVALRALCQFPDASRPARGQAAYARNVIMTGSATLLAAAKHIHGALKPNLVIDWLQREGQGDLAAGLAKSFPG